MVSLAKSPSIELGNNIRINNLVPGRFDTDPVRALYQGVAETADEPIETYIARHDVVLLGQLDRNGQSQWRWSTQVAGL